MEGLWVWIISHLGATGAIILAVVRIIESIYEWYNKSETKGVLSALWDILKNFATLETYKK